MLFTQPEFLGFFALVFAAYYAVSVRGWQVRLLLAASFVFYAWHTPALLLLLLFSIVVNAVASHQVARRGGRVRLAWAAAGVILNLLLLATFKYGGLLAGLVTSPEATLLDGWLASLAVLPLPVGISFYTFEGISLLVDVLKGKVRPLESAGHGAPSFRRHLENTGLFIAFFPHLAAGPILKAAHFFPQIGAKRLAEIRWSVVVRSLITGFFLKMVVADNLKDFTFWLEHPFCLTLGRLNAAVLLFGYSMQIFADFAGYSLIAIGLGAALGYELPPNFHAPYLARSLAEFWRRWHISLSTWLRDYLYIPLGGNRHGTARMCCNLLVVMALGGLWHGAAWSFLLWGCYHGVGLVVERLLRTALSERAHDDFERPASTWKAVASWLPGALRMAAVFAFVSAGWMLFKLTDIRHVLAFGQMLVSGEGAPLNLSQALAVACFSLPAVVFHLLHLPFVERWLARHRQQPGAGFQLLEEGVFAFMLAAVFLNSGTSDAFIYFQF